MWTISLISFLLITFLIGFLSKEDLAEVLPISVGGLLLLLYILGFFRSMSVIGGILACILLIFVVAFALMGKPGRDAFLKELKAFYINPQSMVILIGTVTVAALTRGHIATWWDDINFWATDAKAMYFINGFAGKYGNVAPEFGDYPPILQIAKWCFTKINPYEYREGLAFAGYYVTNLIFSLPLLKLCKGKGIWYQISGVILMFLLPGVCNEIWSHGACADVTMGIIYGALLISIMDFRGHRASVYYSKIGILFSLLVLTKSVGFEWAIFAAIFFVAVTLINKAKLCKNYGNRYMIYTLITIMTGVSVQLSWWTYCIINRRIAKLTSSGISMVSRGFNIREASVKKAKIFIDAFVSEPVHNQNGGVFNLSSLTILVIIIGAIILLYIFKKIKRNEAVFLLIYNVVTVTVTYGLIFLGHISIFAGETQYETADIMAISISRYAAPYTLGMLMLLIYMIWSRMDDAQRNEPKEAPYRGHIFKDTNSQITELSGNANSQNNYKEKRSVAIEPVILIGTSLFILLTTDYKAASTALFNYKNEIEEGKTVHETMLEGAGRLYMEELDGKTELWGKRILFLRDGSSPHWVRDTYINHAVAPVATVYGDILPEASNINELFDIIKKSHGEYIYIEDLGHRADSEIVEEFLSNFTEDGNVFEYGKVYKIFYKDNEIRLGKFIAN